MSQAKTDLEHQKSDQGDKKIYRVLSLDGGGIRGIVTAKLLEKIEADFLIPEGKTLNDYFDMFAGTSTGSIIAAGLAEGKSISEISRLYEEEGSNIFKVKEKDEKHIKQTILESLKNTGINSLIYISRFLQKNHLVRKILDSLPDLLPHLKSPKYTDEGIISILGKEITSKFGDVKNSKKRLLITSYCTQTKEPILFDSDKIEFQNTELSDAVACSSAAPIFFPSQEFIGFNGTKHSLIDGGLIANNPAVLAAAHAHNTNKGHEIRLLSIGTGDVTKSYSYDESKKMGIIDWFTSKPSIFDTFSDGHSDASELILDLLVGAPKYCRIQPDLSEHNIGGIDDVSIENIGKLNKAAEYYFNDNEHIEEIKEFFDSQKRVKSLQGIQP